MKILYVAYHYAPYNCVASVRSTKITKYLHQRGHDIRVLTAADQLLPDDLKVEIPKEKVIYSDWININKPFEILAGGKSEIAKDRSYLSSKQKKKSSIKWAVKTYKNLFYFPDGFIGWIPKALKNIHTILKDWRPDIMYVSGGPFSGFILGALINRKYDIPWVAEYRDLWTGAHNYSYGKKRETLEGFLEKKTVSTAKAFVTVSNPLADLIRMRTNKDVHVITNGFDFEDRNQLKRNNIRFPLDKLNIVYTGQIYIENQDLGPLLNALIQNIELQDNVLVHLYGPNLKAKIESEFTSEVLSKLEDNIKYYGLVSRELSMEAQENSDLLLLLGWADKNYGGILTGKLFEYMSAKRPILAINNYKDDASKIVEQINSGQYCSNVANVIDCLTFYLNQKKKSKFINSTDSNEIVKYSYTAIASQVEKVLEKIVE